MNMAASLTIKANVTLKLDSVTIPSAAVVVFYSQPTIYSTEAVQFSNKKVMVTVKASWYILYDCFNCLSRGDEPRFFNEHYYNMYNMY